MNRKKNLLQMILMIMGYVVNSKRAHPPPPRGLVRNLSSVVGPGSGEFVRKPLLGGGTFVNSPGSD